MFKTMIEKLKKDQQKLVFTEGTDPRILEAASRLRQEKILAPILLEIPKKFMKRRKNAAFL